MANYTEIIEGRGTPTGAVLLDISHQSKEFILEKLPRMYRHERVMRVMGEAEKIVEELFAYFLKNPSDLPAEWGEGIAAAGRSGRARRIGDYIAGMTDRYALIEHARLFGRTYDLR